jgi:hypothetical protein
MIIHAIDSYLPTRQRDDRPRRCFHPSSLHLSADELYRHYLEGDGEREFDSRVLRIFDNGHAVHRRLQGYLTDIGILKRAEVPVENEEYEVRGHADGIIGINGTTGVLEIKSMNSGQFYRTFEPKGDHLIQVNVYMFCLDIPRACLLYECKDDQHLREFYVKQDRSVLEPILEKIKFVQDRVRGETRRSER